MVHILAQPELTGPLLREVWVEDKNGTFNASWVFDHLMRKNLTYLLPVFEPFVQGLGTLTSASCIRPMAHVCEMVTEVYFTKKDAAFQNTITEKQLETILAVCFDWLIGDHKTASKVFAMSSVYHLGKKFVWVHPALQQVLEDTLTSGSTGYRHRAKKTLSRLTQSGY